MPMRFAFTLMLLGVPFGILCFVMVTYVMPALEALTGKMFGM